MATELPTHVWIRNGTSRTAGLLFGWQRQPDGTWLGQVATLDAEGDPALYWFNANLLTPVQKPDAT